MDAAIKPIIIITFAKLIVFILNCRCVMRLSHVCMCVSFFQWYFLFTFFLFLSLKLPVLNHLIGNLLLLLSYLADNGKSDLFIASLLFTQSLYNIMEYSNRHWPVDGRWNWKHFWKKKLNENHDEYNEKRKKLNLYTLNRDTNIH